MTSTQVPSILMISSEEEPDKVAMIKRFAATLSDLLKGHRIEWASYRDIAMAVIGGKLQAFLIADDRPLTDFAAIYFKSYGHYFEQAAALAELLEAAGVPFGGREFLQAIPEYKLSQMTRLAISSVPQPDTLYMSMKAYGDQFVRIRTMLGVPFVFKAIDGMKGQDNYLVTDEKMLKELVARHADRHFIAQQFIQNDGDFRLLIVRQQLKLIIRRQRTSEDTHLNNTSKGATADLVAVDTFDKRLADISLRAAACMERDVVGVDLLLERGTLKPYILEVNASPQLATGAFVHEKLAIVADYLTKLVEPKE